MNPTENTPTNEMNKSISDSLDIDDPELIKFMNTKMNVENETILDLFYDIAEYAFQNVVVAPCHYIYEQMVNFDFTQFFSKEFLDQFRTTLFLNGPVMSKEVQETSCPLPTIPEENEVETDHVLVENNGLQTENN